jgi:hypothetical protein
MSPLQGLPIPVSRSSSTPLPERQASIGALSAVASRPSIDADHLINFRSGSPRDLAPILIPPNGQILYSVELCYWLVRTPPGEIGELRFCGS